MFAGFRRDNLICDHDDEADAAGGMDAGHHRGRMYHRTGRTGGTGVYDPLHHHAVSVSKGAEGTVAIRAGNVGQRDCPAEHAAASG